MRSTESSESPAGVTPCCRRFRVRGRVQGVFFRASTRDVARRLQLSGYAVNRPDGTVEVVACGGDAALKELEAWLETGPPTAEVDAVEACEQPFKTYSGFSCG